MMCRIERLIASGSFFKEIKVEGLSQSRDMRQAADVQLYAPDSSASIDRPLGKHVRQVCSTLDSSCGDFDMDRVRWSMYSLLLLQGFQHDVICCVMVWYEKGNCCK